MLRPTVRALLKARPKTVNVEPGSNRYLEPKILEKAKDVFAVPEFPNKLVLHNWRFFIRAGKAATGPPIGQEFTKMGLKAMDFAKAFNDRTKPHLKDDVDVIVRIQVYFDKSYQYRIEPPPTAWFILRAVRKKRGETGGVPHKGCFCALMTLEMCYEIAKMKQMSWGRLEYPPIETRARRVAGQARRMGICIIGCDTPSSPVKGLTPRQYEAECEKYRAIHAQQYAEFKKKELEEAPLIERLHRVDLSPLSDARLEEGLSDAGLFHALWTATHPRSPYLRDREEREAARRYLNVRGWFPEMTADEMRTVFANHRAPALGPGAAADGGEGFWDRDGVKS